jgi:hypothetical protein
MTTKKQQQPEAARPAAPSVGDSSVHPETRQPPQKLPDDESSKRSPAGPPDGRSPHDRDGNSQQRHAAGGRK